MNKTPPNLDLIYDKVLDFNESQPDDYFDSVIQHLSENTPQVRNVFDNLIGVFSNNPSLLNALRIIFLFIYRLGAPAFFSLESSKILELQLDPSINSPEILEIKRITKYCVEKFQKMQAAHEIPNIGHKYAELCNLIPEDPQIPDTQLTEFEKQYSELSVKFQQAEQRLEVLISDNHGSSGPFDTSRIVQLLEQIDGLMIQPDLRFTKAENELILNFFHQRYALINRIQNEFPQVVQDYHFMKEEKRAKILQEKGEELQTENNQKQVQEVQNLKDFTFFIEGTSLAAFPESMTVEYKDYIYPFSNDTLKKKLKASICAFLNTNGGRILIGVRNTGFRVKGLFLTTNDQDNLIRDVDALLREFHPKVDPEEVTTTFIPIKKTDGSYKPGFYVVKILVKTCNHHIKKAIDVQYQRDHILFTFRNKEDATRAYAFMTDNNFSFKGKKVKVEYQLPVKKSSGDGIHVPKGGNQSQSIKKIESMPLNTPDIMQASNSSTDYKSMLQAAGYGSVAVFEPHNYDMNNLENVSSLPQNAFINSGSIQNNESPNLTMSGPQGLGLDYSNVTFNPGQKLQHSQDELDHLIKATEALQTEIGVPQDIFNALKMESASSMNSNQQLQQQPFLSDGINPMEHNFSLQNHPLNLASQKNQQRPESMGAHLSYPRENSVFGGQAPGRSSPSQEQQQPQLKGPQPPTSIQQSLAQFSNQEPQSQFGRPPSKGGMNQQGPYPPQQFNPQFQGQNQQQPQIPPRLGSGPNLNQPIPQQPGANNGPRLGTGNQPMNQMNQMSYGNQPNPSQQQQFLGSQQQPPRIPTQPNSTGIPNLGSQGQLGPKESQANMGNLNSGPQQNQPFPPPHQFNQQQPQYPPNTQPQLHEEKQRQTGPQTESYKGSGPQQPNYQQQQQQGMYPPNQNYNPQWQNQQQPPNFNQDPNNFQSNQYHQQNPNYYPPQFNQNQPPYGNPQQYPQYPPQQGGQNQPQGGGQNQGQGPYPGQWQGQYPPQNQGGQYQGQGPYPSQWQGQGQQYPPQNQQKQDQQQQSQKSSSKSDKKQQQSTTQGQKDQNQKLGQQQGQNQQQQQQGYYPPQQQDYGMPPYYQGYPQYPPQNQGGNQNQGYYGGQNQGYNQRGNAPYPMYNQQMQGDVQRNGPQGFPNNPQYGGQHQNYPNPQQKVGNN